MLKQLRNKKTAKKVWIVLAIIIVPAFVLWGSGSLMRNKGEDDYAGKLFGKKISILEYREAYDAAKNMAIMQFGDNLEEVKKYLNLEQQAWERIILLHEAKKYRLNASDKEVIELVQSYPFFQYNKKFDDKTYAEMLRYVFRVQPRVFEEQVRQGIIISKLYDKITDKVALNDTDIKNEYKKLSEEMSLYYIASLPSDFTTSVTPTEQDVKDYFEKNKVQFKQPLSFNLEYISVDSEQKIQAIAARLKRRGDLKNIAKDYNIEMKETGLFAQTEPIPGIGWSQDLLNILMKLKVGDSSPIIRVDKNFFILKVKEIKEPYIPDFDKVKDKVKETLIKEKTTELAKAKIEECLKWLKKERTTDFNRAAKASNLKSSSTELFKYGGYIEGIGVSDNLWTAANELKDNAYSGVIQMPSGFYIIKMKSRTAMDEKKFQGEKKEFTKKLTEQKKQEAFAKFLEDLRRKAQ